MKLVVLSVALLVAACSDAAPSSMASGAAAAAGGGGTPAAAGSATSGAGMSTGGSASGAAGAASGGAAGMSGAAGGASGAAGAAGQGGGAPAAPEAELDGAGWTMTCTKPREGNLCELMPPGQDTCPADGYTSLDKTLHFGGTPGTIYDVTIHFQGTHEAGDYTGGTAGPAQFLKGATHTDAGLHTWLSMEVSSPAASYNPNAGAGGGTVTLYDYSATIQIEGGATIELKAHDIDCLMHRYCQDNNTNPCKGLVQGDVSPAAAPIDGSFLTMDVTAVVAK